MFIREIMYLIENLYTFFHTAPYIYIYGCKVNWDENLVNFRAKTKPCLGTSKKVNLLGLFLTWTLKRKITKNIYKSI